MKIEQLTRNSREEVIVGKLPRGHMNGLLISISRTDPVSNDWQDLIHNLNISAKFTHSDVEHLITTMKLSPLIELSNIDYGSTGTITRLFDEVLYAGASPIDLGPGYDSETDRVYLPTTTPVLEDQVLCYIDLGSIFCENGNEFHYQIGNNTHDGGGNSYLNFNVYAVSNDIEPFHFWKYDLDTDLNENHKQVVRSLLFTETIEKDFDVYVKSLEGNYESDGEGFRAYAQMFGKIENIGLGLVYDLFKSEQGVPQDVWIKIARNTGAELQRVDSDMGILNLRLDVPAGLTTSKNVDIMKKRAEIARQFEQADPQLASILRASGMFVTSAEFEQKAKELI